MRQIVLVAHNLRSCYNVGSILRTADCLGVDEVFLTGYTPYPVSKNDDRLPHLADKVARQIHKSSLGAEDFVRWERIEQIEDAIRKLKEENFVIAALEQDPHSVNLIEFNPSPKIALIVGREVEGIEQEIKNQVDKIIEIPMSGKKESLNVAQAAAIALYHCKYWK